MDGFEFVASLVESLAWPIAAVVTVLILRTPLARALSGPVKRWKAGPAGVEVEYWDATIEALRGELSPPVEPPGGTATTAGLEEELTAVAAVSPRAAVLEAFARVEAALQGLLNEDDTTASDRMGGLRLARVARARGAINDETLHAIEGMVVLRNLAAHAAGEVDAPRAAEFIALADAVLFTLRRPRRD